jgi:hypothetical protein
VCIFSQQQSSVSFTIARKAFPATNMEAFEGFLVVQKNATELTYADEYPVHTMFLLEAICFFRQFGVTRTIRLLQYTFSR